MVFGNMGDSSATGVAFTRNPSTGEKQLYGDYLVNAQGEDVVAGIRNTSPIARLADEMPAVYQQFQQIAERLEQHYRDVQDMEFTIEQGQLYMLQTRTAKRTAAAAVKTAVDMVSEGLITADEAVQRVEPESGGSVAAAALRRRCAGGGVTREAPPGQGRQRLTGRGGGRWPSSTPTAPRRRARLARQSSWCARRPAPTTYHGMLVAKGILTSQGGTGSHAAVVARGLGLPAVVGCEGIRVDYAQRQFEVKATGLAVHEGDDDLHRWHGPDTVYQGAIKTVEANYDDEHDLHTLLAWADETRKLGVWANADYPRDAERAINFGAEGIGLCRTEHMFMEQERLPIVQEMILAPDAGGAPGEARSTAPLPAVGLRGHLPRNGQPRDGRGLSRRHPADRPAAA